MRAVIRRHRNDLCALAFILVVALGVTWPVTLGGRAMLPTGLYLRMQPWRAHAAQFPDFRRPQNPILDAVQQFYPWRLYASRQVREGIVPLWNPLMLCGTPFVGNNQSAIFYPETWLHYFMEPLRALGWATALFFFLAGSFMYGFLRTIRVRPLASTIGAVAFMLNGFFIGWLCFPTFRSVGAWLPLMLLGFEKAVRSERPAWLGLTALGTGMQFLAGNLHISVYVLMGFGAYVIARVAHLLMRGGTWRRAARDAGLAVAAVAVGTMLAGCQLGPSLEMAALCSRTGTQSYAQQMTYALAPPYLLLALMPDAFGNPVDYNHWGAELNCWWGRAYRTYTETAWYIGIAPLLLGIAGLAVRPRRQSWFWLGIWLLALALVFGTPLDAVLYYLVPGFNKLSGLSRAFYLACTAGSVLAALGADALMRKDARERNAGRTVIATSLALLTMGVIAGAYIWVVLGSTAIGEVQLGAYTLAQVGRFALLVVASAALILWGVTRGSTAAWCGLAVLVVIDLGIFAQKFTPEGRTEYLKVKLDVISTVKADREPVRFCSVGDDFLNRMAPNVPMLFDLQDIQGSDSLVYGRYQRVLGGISNERMGYLQPDPALPALDLLGVKYLLTPLRIEDKGWRLEQSYETRLYVNEDAMPRAFVPRSVEWQKSDDEILGVVTGRQLDPWVIHLLRSEAQATTSPRIEAADAGAVEISHYGTNRVELSGDFRAGQWIVLSDVLYPGWRVYVDGDEGTIVPANYVLRAVHLSRPARTVTFSYLPASFQLGAFASSLALAALAALAAAVALRRRCGE